jgi:hypothetical protein
MYKLYRWLLLTLLIAALTACQLTALDNGRLTPTAQQSNENEQANEPETIDPELLAVSLQQVAAAVPTEQLGEVTAAQPGEAAALNATDKSVQAAFFVPGCFPRSDWPIYVVRAGDTLSRIASRTNTTWGVLARANCLVNPNLIYVNQLLHVPNLPVNSLPVLTSPGTPNPNHCIVVRNGDAGTVYIYSGGGDAGAVPVAILGNFLPYTETLNEGYIVPIPGIGRGTGWVSVNQAHLVGPCGSKPVPSPDLPVFTLPGSPPVEGCWVTSQPGIQPTLIFHGPSEAHGSYAVLSNYARFLSSFGSRYEISTPGHGRGTGWVNQSTTVLTGSDCPKTDLVDSTDDTDDSLDDN